MRVLIAEDNEDQQELIKMLMREWGYVFDLVPDGRKAVELALIHEGKYDLCLMDIDMPVMNGIEATETIRRKTKYFPIMALTGNSPERDIYLKIGMDDFLKKPYRPKELYHKIGVLTSKYFRIEFKENNNICVRKEMPMNQQHAKEIRELAQKGLCKMNIRGIGAHDVVIITHKNVPCKISQDFIGNNEEVSIFLDRSEDKPAECHLYKSSCPMPTIYLMEEEYEEKRAREDEILKQCTAMVIKSKSGS